MVMYRKEGARNVTRFRSVERRRLSLVIEIEGIALVEAERKFPVEAVSKEPEREFFLSSHPGNIIPRPLSS